MLLLSFTFVTLYNCILDNTKVDWLDACVITQKEECLTLKDVELVVVKSVATF